MRQIFLLYFSFLIVCTSQLRAQSAGGQDTTSKQPVSSQLQSVRCSDDVLLYPNPAAGNELNVVYDASADVKNIAVYNLIGKMVAVYKVTDPTSANLSLESLAPGIYFVRLFNTQGEVVLARKFTRQ